MWAGPTASLVGWDEERYHTTRGAEKEERNRLSTQKQEITF